MFIRIAAAAFAALVGSAAQAADLPEPVDPAGETVDQASLGSETFAACQSAIAQWAQPYDPVDIRTVTAGPVERKLFGRRVAPLLVQITYETQGGLETRKANVDCTVRANNSVAVEPAE